MVKTIMQDTHLTVVRSSLVPRPLSREDLGYCKRSEYRSGYETIVSMLHLTSRGQRMDLH